MLVDTSGLDTHEGGQDLEALRLFSPQAHFHADAQTAHAAVSRIEAVATGDQVRPVFNRVHVRFMFNVALYPPAREQDSKRIAALDNSSVFRVVQGIVSAIGRGNKGINRIICRVC
jgi:hypothetical protein